MFPQQRYQRYVTELPLTDISKILHQTQKFSATNLKPIFVIFENFSQRFRYGPEILHSPGTRRIRRPRRRSLSRISCLRGRMRFFWGISKNFQKIDARLSTKKFFKIFTRSQYFARIRNYKNEKSLRLFYIIFGRIIKFRVEGDFFLNRI